MNMGPGPETQDALLRLETRMNRGAVTILGQLAPDSALCEQYRRRGALEGSAEEYRAPTHTVVVPLTGLSKPCVRRWKESGHQLLDLTLPAVRRAQTSLNLLALERCKPVVIGSPADAESIAIAGEVKGSIIVEDGEQASMLSFSPKFGVVCQTGISRRQANGVVEALRLRHPDSRIVFLDTTSPANLERERSVEALSRWSEVVIVTGEASEASVRTLMEASRRLGVPTICLPDVASCEPKHFSQKQRIGIATGEFSPEAVSEGIIARLETEPSM